MLNLAAFICQSAYTLLLTRLILLLLPGSLRDERLQRRTGAALIRSAAFSPIMMVAALVFPFTMVGIMEASTTRRPAVPRTRNRSSTTASASGPILHVPTG